MSDFAIAIACNRAEQGGPSLPPEVADYPQEKETSTVLKYLNYCQLLENKYKEVLKTVMKNTSFYKHQTLKSEKWDYAIHFIKGHPLAAYGLS